MTRAEQIRRDASDAAILAARFPNMSKSTMALNSHPPGPHGICAGQFIHPDGSKTPIAAVPSPADMPQGRTELTASEFLQQNKGNTAERLVIRLSGQARGGKNAIGVTKSGKHYAKPAFKAWRAEMAAQIRQQLPQSFVCITAPVNIRVSYTSGDRKRRDQTGILDAIFHLLEYCQVIHDDSLLWVSESSRAYDKSSPGVSIEFLG
jgi:hypothetical protein